MSSTDGCRYCATEPAEGFGVFESSDSKSPAAGVDGTESGNAGRSPPAGTAGAVVCVNVGDGLDMRSSSEERDAVFIMAFRPSVTVLLRLRLSLGFLSRTRPWGV